MENLNENDFVLYKNKGGGIESIGMKFENLFRDNNLPAMVGGGIGSHNKFGNIGIPVGLYMMNRQIKSADKSIHSRTLDGGVIKDDIYNRLLNMAEQREKKRGKTKKNRKKSKRKTRKMR